MIADIKSAPPTMRGQKALELGIGTTGSIHSRLVLSADGYEFGEVWMPCIDLSGLFNFLPGFAKPGKTGDLASIPPFFEALHAAIREAINVVRVGIGLPRIGEGWVTETYLFYRIKELLPDETVVHHGRPRWLGRQHFDIWLPQRNIAIEYQGEQHFVEISLFGGKEGLARTQKRDAQKRRLCLDNGVNLIEISFNDDFRDVWLKSLLGIK
jgi:hypothetical protein